MVKGYFVTGTDTGVGKTLVAAGLVRALAGRGERVAGLKPVAAGCDVTPEGLRNADALLLMAESTVRLPYETVNPFAYAPAIAPHLAAAEADLPIDLEVVKTTQAEAAAEADWLIVEGAGGWLVPLNDGDTLADLAVVLDLPVVLVVGLRLGCLSHALLTVESIERHGCRLAGWVANALEPTMARQAENIAALQARIAAPLLGVVPHQEPPRPQMAADALEPLLHSP